MDDHDIKRMHLKWNQHINIITAKTNRVLGMLRRNLRRAPRQVKQAAYTTLVRPRVAYCSTMWDPLNTRNNR